MLVQTLLKHNTNSQCQDAVIQCFIYFDWMKFRVQNDIMPCAAKQLHTALYNKTHYIDKMCFINSFQNSITIQYDQLNLSVLS